MCWPTNGLYNNKYNLKCKFLKKKKTLEFFIRNFNDMQLFLMFLLWMAEGNQTIYALQLLCVCVWDEYRIWNVKQTIYKQPLPPVEPICVIGLAAVGRRWFRASDPSFIWVGKQYGNFLFRKIYKIFVSSYNLAYYSMFAYHIKLNLPKFSPENFSKRVTETSWHERNVKRYAVDLVNRKCKVNSELMLKVNF